MYNMGATLLKSDPSAGDFRWIMWNFYEHFFRGHLRTNASECTPKRKTHQTAFLMTFPPFISLQLNWQGYLIDFSPNLATL